MYPISKFLKQINVVKPDGALNSNLKIILNKNPKILDGVIDVTTFLEVAYPDISLRQRVYSILHNITEIPICNNDTCRNIVKFQRGYNRYCSNSCIGRDDKIQEKKKDTCLINHGVENPSQSSTIATKKKKTTIKNYGVENPFQSKKIKNKIKKNNNEKYGVDHYVQTKDFQDKFTDTMNERYGKPHALQVDEFEKKRKGTLMDKHGVGYPLQINMSSSSLDKLKDGNWMNEQHVEQAKSLLQISEELNVSDSTVGVYLHKHGIETQNHFQSMGECEVNDFVTSMDIPTVQNTRSIIAPYELDIYIPDHTIAIEYCGLYWHSEAAGKDKHYHKNKHDLCANKGIQLITIFADEWKNRNDQVKSKIRSLLGKDDSPSIYARKTHIIKVLKPEKQTFYDLHHIQGGCGSSVDLGLTYYGILVACMSFINRGDGEYELTRYATSGRVVGGFSKLFKYFTTHIDFTRVVSFADLRWSTGNLYQVNGWKVDSIIPPDYQYSPDAKTRYHKFNFRRKNLSKLLNNFDPALTERENCDNNNILRIWDCGKIRFIFDAVK